MGKTSNLKYYGPIIFKSQLSEKDVLARYRRSEEYKRKMSKNSLEETIPELGDIISNLDSLAGSKETIYSDSVFRQNTLTRLATCLIAYNIDPKRYAGRPDFNEIMQAYNEAKLAKVQPINENEGM